MSECSDIERMRSAKLRVDEAEYELRQAVSHLVEYERQPFRDDEQWFDENDQRIFGHRARDKRLSDLFVDARKCASKYKEARAVYAACVDFAARVDARMADLVTPVGVEKALAGDVRPRRTEEITRLNRALDGIDDALTKLERLGSR